MNIFEASTRNKYRFPYRGLISVEDLWDLNIIQLDGVYKALSSEAKTFEEDSLINKQTKNVELSDKINIVKYIFETKQNEALARKTAAENEAKKQQILDIIAQKQNESLKNMTEEELKKLLCDME